MAVAGDIVSYWSTNSASNGMRGFIQPSIGEQWVIHNIYFDQPVNIYISNNNGVEIKIFSETQAGSIQNLTIHCAGYHFLVVENTTANETNYGCDGIVTKFDSTAGQPM